MWRVFLRVHFGGLELFNRRQMRLFLIAGLGALVLFNYQNCSPPGSLQDHSLGANETNNGSIRVIEDWELSKLSFVENSLEIAFDLKELMVEGLCSRQNHDQLNWRFTSADDNEVSRGAVDCEGGGFALSLPHVEAMECGSAYFLAVVSPQGDQSRLSITRRCASLSSVAVANPQGFEQNCFIEENFTPDLGKQCQKVCYAGGRVYFEQMVEPQFCPDI